jgi:hypothetical protein
MIYEWLAEPQACASPAAEREKCSWVHKVVGAQMPATAAGPAPKPVLLLLSALSQQLMHGV